MCDRNYVLEVRIREGNWAVTGDASQFLTFILKRLKRDKFYISLESSSTTGYVEHKLIFENKREKNE